MLSNYPPGVTGRELEIAGPDWEGVLERKCAAKDVALQVLMPDDIFTLKRVAAAKGAQGSGRARDADVIQQTLKGVFARATTVTLPACPFEGSVDAWAYHGTTHWSCPVCGTETEENADE